MITPETGRGFARDGGVVKKDSVFIRDFKGGCRQGLAVHFDTASFDQFFRFAPRGHARPCEEFRNAFALYLFACFILHS